LDKKRILILDGDSRQALPFMRSLKRAGHNVIIVCPRRFCPGFFSRYADSIIIWPEAGEHESKFYSALLNYVKKGNCDVVLALGDATAHLVSYHKKELAEFVSVPIPDYDIFLRAADKGWTMLYCMENNIACPKTYDPAVEKFEKIISEISFPVVIKPRYATGATGLCHVASAEQLHKEYAEISNKYGPVIIQEYIQSRESQLQVEAFCNRDSKVVVCMAVDKPRYYPVSGGTATCNVTISNDDVIKIVSQLLEGIGWVGLAEVDLIVDERDGKAKVLEINPRASAGIKIGFKAGMDFADLQLRFACGQDISVYNDYKCGIILRNLCMDILWYIKSGRKKRSLTSPKFWQFFGRDVYYQTFSYDDPLPLLGFVMGSFFKFIKRNKQAGKVYRDLRIDERCEKK
jgi:predicted ATP-grasp superfamily ATP-dependent carboligase